MSSTLRPSPFFSLAAPTKAGLWSEFTISWAMTAATITLNENGQ